MATFNINKKSNSDSLYAFKVTLEPFLLLIYKFRTLMDNNYS